MRRKDAEENAETQRGTQRREGEANASIRL